MQNENEVIRKLELSQDFYIFFEGASMQVQNKIKYVLGIIRTQKIIPEKFVKKLQNTEFYEMRVSVGTNEYRTVLLSFDHENIQEATQVLVLNSFLKKSNKDYKKAVEKARTILENKKDIDNENDKQTD